MTGQPAIEDVLSAHRDRLMSIPGVTGAGQGWLRSGEPCINIMLAEDLPDAWAQVPARLDGFTVQVIITGEIQAL
jgi:hypothetical protein